MSAVSAVLPHTRMIMPIVVFFAVMLPLIKRKNAYSEFLSGAEDGMKTVASIFPPLVGMMCAAAMMRESGLLSAVVSVIMPLARAVHIPEDALILAVMRPVSGSGSLALLTDIIARCGADSRDALCAAVMCGSTETTLYTMSVYFARTRAKCTPRLMCAALVGDAVCAVVSGLVCSVWFG